MVYSRKKEQELLEDWDAAFNKSALKFWVLISLKENDKSVPRLQEFLWDVGIHVSNQALYRALRRWKTQGLVDFGLTKVTFGQAPRSFRLTPEGSRLLELINSKYIKKFYEPKIERLIKRKP